MESRILLTETTFTNLCKSGSLTHQWPKGGSQYGSTNIYITKSDMKKLTSGDILEKNFDDDIVKIALQDIGLELIREIIRRSPIYSELYYEI